MGTELIWLNIIHEDGVRERLHISLKMWEQLLKIMWERWAEK
jgi:hypothetical protein